MRATIRLWRSNKLTRVSGGRERERRRRVSPETATSPVMPRTGVSSGHGKKECPPCHLLVAHGTNTCPGCSYDFRGAREAARGRGRWRAAHGDAVAVPRERADPRTRVTRLRRGGHFSGERRPGPRGRGAQGPHRAFESERGPRRPRRPAPRRGRPVPGPPVDVAAAPAPADGDVAAPVVRPTFVSLVGDASGAADADAAAADIEPTLYGEPNEHGLLRDHKKGMPITRCMACKRCLPRVQFITTPFLTLLVGFPRRQLDHAHVRHGREHDRVVEAVGLRRVHPRGHRVLHAVRAAVLG